MKQSVIVAWDDLDHAEGRKTDSDEEHTLELDGHAVALDLTTEHGKALVEFLAPYLAAGQTISQPKAGRAPRRDRAYYSGMREWADKHDRTREYRLPGGQIKYRKTLVADYDAYLAGRGES